jgi:hypothetical protein
MRIKPLQLLAVASAGSPISHQVQPFRGLKIIAAAVFVAAVYAEAVFSQQHTDANNLFTEAGFIVQYADTPEKLGHLKKLPPDKLVTRLRNGTKYYVYADPNICQCAYVGTPQAYRAYQAGVGGPQPGQSNSDPVFDQEIAEFNEDGAASVIGAPSFDDYVFGGMRDD